MTGHDREFSKNMSVVTLIGLVAAFCTTLAYAPQALKTWRTRQTRDISLGMFALMVTGVALWLVYGVLIEDLPLILANLVTLSLAGTILVLKLRHG
jgi:MtN3 and saliva related transmembrane protein